MMIEAMSGPQLRWRCRRGMLELDILLNAFLDREHAGLTADQNKTFHALLDYPDQVLFDLLMDKARACDDNTAELVRRIRAAVY